MLCSRCLDLVDVAQVNFCPQCGRDFRRVRSSVPTDAELRLFVSEMTALLPKLRQLRDELENDHRAAERNGLAALIARNRQRLLFLLRVEDRLLMLLERARERLADEPRQR